MRTSILTIQIRCHDAFERSTTMSDDTTPVSPTGQALLPPKVVHVLAPLYAILSASAVGLLAAYDATPKEYAIASLAIGILGSLLGMSSPGLRKVVPLLLVCSLAGLSSCVHVKEIAKSTFDCTESSVKAQLPGLESEVTNALVSSFDAWVPALEDLAVKVGVDVLKCAVQAVIAQLQNPTIAPETSAYYAVSVGFVTPSERLARAQAWLAVH
jgi:hypothetical protein